MYQNKNPIQLEVSTKDLTETVIMHHTIRTIRKSVRY